MGWVLAASILFAAAMAGWAIWRRIRATRFLEAHRAEVEAISGHYGIPIEDAVTLIGLPPEELSARATKIALENR